MKKLLDKIKKPDKARQFSIWVNQYHAALYKHALWMTGSNDLAQEMTQEAFYQAWACIHSLKDHDKALPWLLTILRRAVYREQRYQYRNKETCQALGNQDQEYATEDSVTLLEIYHTMEQLTPKLRDTFLLYHLHGFSYEEISEQLQIPTGTVMSRLSRARQALQEQTTSNNTKIIEFSRHHRGIKHEG